MDKPAYWVSIRQAAQLLAKSERTIRRWERDGKLTSDRTGPGILVDIGGLMPDKPEGVGTVIDTSSEVDLLRAEIERLQERLADCQAERDRLWTALDNTQALALTMAGERPMLTEEAGKRPRRSWRWPWQRGD